MPMASATSAVRPGWSLSCLPISSRRSVTSFSRSQSALPSSRSATALPAAPRRARTPLLLGDGSAGSIDALEAVVAGFPPDLPAAVFVVVHTAPYVPSRLADVLRRAGPLDAVAAANGAPLELGKIVVAPPDEHLLIEPGRVRLAHGPKENRARPAIDPLFRSAALHYGPRVLGVILSGALDDGTPGLWVVKDRGGIAIVQDPADALLPSMPTSALTN